MGFHEVQFPTDQAYDSEFGAGWRTAIVELDSGSEERVSRWDSPRHRYDLAHSIRTIDALNTVKDFYWARQGAAFGFRFKDWSDYTSASDHRSAPAFQDQNIGTGDGTTATFQLRKTYSSGGIDKTRKITKPVNGTVLIGVNGVQQTEGTHYSINYTTGLVTFDAGDEPANTHPVTAGFEYDVPVRFDEDADEVLALEWESFEQGNMSIPLKEIVDEEPNTDEFFYGGSKVVNYDIDTVVTVADGRMLRLEPQTAIKKLILPKATTLAGGGPYFYLQNLGTVDTDLYEQADPVTDPPVSLSLTLAAATDDKVIAVIGKNASGTPGDNTNNQWYFFKVS